MLEEVGTEALRKAGLTASYLPKLLLLSSHTGTQLASHAQHLLPKPCPPRLCPTVPSVHDGHCHPHRTENPCSSPKILLKISSKFRWVLHLGGCNQGGKPWGLFLMYYFLSRRFVLLFYMPSYVLNISS